MQPTSREMAIYQEVSRGLPVYQIAASYQVTQAKVVEIFAKCAEWRRKEGANALS